MEIFIIFLILLIFKWILIFIAKKNKSDKKAKEKNKKGE